MKVIIAGAGIAGPVAAIALAKTGISVEIIETRDAAEGDEGLFLGLASNGHRVLEGLELDACVRGQPHIRTPQIAFFGARGNRLGNVTSGYCDSDVPITLMRRSLHEALSAEAERRGISIRRGHTVTDYQQGTSGVNVRCSDGQVLRADLLIGADGIRSNVRAAMPGQRLQPDYTGLLNLGGVVPHSGLRSTEGEMRMVWGSRAFFGYAVREDGEAWWFANIGAAKEPSKNELKSAQGDWGTQLTALFDDDLPLITDLIRNTPEIHAYPIHDLPHVPRWQDGRVLLIGDAAHATSPSSGQGASLALEDAAFLAVCLRDITDPVAALARFETERRPRAERIVAEGRRRGAYKAPRTRLQMHLRDTLMPIVFRVFVTDRSLSWIYDYQVPEHAA
ncbi:MAG: FAD-dependent monooxygenase [Pararhodobacter sp.]|nr:FAD-dependent monooxygenase [Pararhodobacter sp.]